ncbi:hypothetical protein D3C71_1174460 [compost metagenome]
MDINHDWRKEIQEYHQQVSDHRRHILVRREKPDERSEARRSCDRKQNYWNKSYGQVNIDMEYEMPDHRHNDYRGQCHQQSANDKRQQEIDFGNWQRGIEGKVALLLAPGNVIAQPIYTHDYYWKYNISADNPHHHIR